MQETERQSNAVPSTRIVVTVVVVVVVVAVAVIPNNLISVSVLATLKGIDAFLYVLHSASGIRDGNLENAVAMLSV
jgi:hypothetical protein